MLLQQTKQTKLLVVNSKTTSRFATLPNSQCENTPHKDHLGRKDHGVECPK